VHRASGALQWGRIWDRELESGGRSQPAFVKRSAITVNTVYVSWCAWAVASQQWSLSVWCLLICVALVLTRLKTVAVASMTSTTTIFPDVAGSDIAIDTRGVPGEVFVMLSTWNAEGSLTNGRLVCWFEFKDSSSSPRLYLCRRVTRIQSACIGVDSIRPQHIHVRDGGTAAPHKVSRCSVWSCVKRDINLAEACLRFLLTKRGPSY